VPASKLNEVTTSTTILHIRKAPLVLRCWPLLVLLGASMAWSQNPSRKEPIVALNRGGIPTWEIDPKFSKDTFTFVRVRYLASRGGFNVTRENRWEIDYPDAELNLGYRLQQVTSLKVSPDPKAFALTDSEIFDYPFIYIVEPGALQLSDPEVAALRRYLLNGGFLMVDDFWGERDWEVFYHEIKRVFPDRNLEELPLEHQIFHCIFPLKEKPQVPGIHNFYRARGTPSESYEGRDAAEVHYKAIFDDRRRMMAIICHNTDLGDAWEQEGENEEYFRKYAEPKSYPMTINIIYYALTH
jgi:hypothetical protein